MVKVAEVYFINKHLKAFERRLAWLDRVITDKTEKFGLNYAGGGFDHAERNALQHLLSQVKDKGEDCNPPAREDSVPRELPGRAFAALMGDGQ